MFILLFVVTLELLLLFILIIGCWLLLFIADCSCCLRWRLVVVILRLGLDGVVVYFCDVCLNGCGGCLLRVFCSCF